MSFNLVDLVTDQIKGPLIGQMGSLLGDESSKASGAVESMIPALLSGLTDTSNTAKGADSLFNAIQKQDDGLLGNIGSMLGGGQASSLIDGGNSVLSSLFGGGGLGKLAGVLAGFSGLSKGGTSSLMGMLAPIIFGIIKKKILGGNMNAGAMATMLFDQKQNISAALPSGLSDQLNTSGFLSSLSDAGSSVTSNVSETVSGAASSVSGAASNVASEVRDGVGDAASGGSSLFKWLLPLVGLVLAGWLAMKFLGGDADVADKAADAATGAVATATEAVADGLPDVDAVGKDLTGLFSSATDALSGVTDADSATAAVPALNEVGTKLSGLTGMIDKIPEAARGPLSGIVSTGLAALEPIIEKVTAIPGVGSIIEPIVGPLLETLRGMAG